MSESSSSRPKLANQNIFVSLGDEYLKLPKGHAAIAVGDWDGDGLWDILSGCDDGAVYWFKNTGKLGDLTPRMEPVVKLERGLSQRQPRSFAEA